MGLPVGDGAVAGGILEDDGEGAVVWGEGEIFGAGDGDLDACGFGAGADDGERLREDHVVDDDAARVGGGGSAEAEGDGFGGGGALVEERGVSDREGGQFRDHGLEVEERFETALTDFGLVGCVGGVPRRVFEDIAEDDGRGDGAVVALADEGFEDLVGGEDGAEIGEGVFFGEGWGDVERVEEPDGGWDGGVDEGVEGFVAAELGHDVAFFREEAEVAGGVGGRAHGGGNGMLASDKVETAS